MTGPVKSEREGLNERGELIRVRLNEYHGETHLLNSLQRLTPGECMVWGRCRFEHNPAHGTTADFAVVLYNARPIDHFVCSPQNTLFIAGEPAAKKVYPPKFYRQFNHLVDTHSLSGHPNVNVSALGLPWFVGLDLQKGGYRYGYDHLVTLPRPEKINRISVVCSNAAHTPGQRSRLAFLDGLKTRLGDQIVHFGRGFKPVDDKMEAILPYRFHLVLENCEARHYWTEKLADAYLGWAFPLYVGCPNLQDYFHPGAYVRLDPENPEAAAKQIQSLLSTPDTEAERAHVAGARRLVLDVYNPVAWCAHWVEKLYRESPQQRITIRSHKAFRPFPRGLIYRLRHRH